MAASQESQGLKIAVVVFVTLSVILAVTTYFGFRAYDQASNQLKEAQSKLADEGKAKSLAVSTIEELRKAIGVKTEDDEAMKNEIKAEHKKIDDTIKSLSEGVAAAIANAQSKGASGPELEEAKARFAQVAAAYLNEPNKTYFFSLSKASELMRNLGLLTNQVSLNYVDVKRALEASNQVNAEQLAKSEEGRQKAETDREDVQKKHVAERQELHDKVGEFQTKNDQLSTERANLETELRQHDEDAAKKLALAQQTIREYRDRVERKEQVLDRPDGKVSFVDYDRNEVHVNVTRSQGARPQMQFAIFDASSPGLPTDKPKGTITLTAVGDRYSIARVDKTHQTINPIREGDFVYSAAWSPNEPMRFALIGKIDVNQDGKDDREDLKRMIEAAGGIVDYDLPPPDAGKETGKLTGRDSWYVIDERKPFRDYYNPSARATMNETAEFLKKQSEAIREARLNGVRPMPIERLLPFLGYDYAAPIRGRAEVKNEAAMKRALAPKQREAAPAPASEEAPKEEPPAPGGEPAAPEAK